MENKSWFKTLCAVIVFVALCLNPLFMSFGFPKDYHNEEASIHLLGEQHGLKEFYEAELASWQEYYAKGDRILFVELPYYTGEFLNEWMKADNDELLIHLYDELEGTLTHTPYALEFYRSIKRTCPQTIFYASDVGHQYMTTGARYLEYLKEQGREDSREYQLAKECMAQGERYYSEYDHEYRERMMVENFLKGYEYFQEELGGSFDLMGIFGSYHTDLRDEDVMGYMLREKLGDIIDSVYVGNILIHKDSYQVGFSYGGLLFLLALMIPNLIWSKYKPKNYEVYAARESKVLLVFERIGEVLVTIILLCFKDFNPFIVMTNEGPIIPPRTYWLGVVIYMFIIYEGYWITYFRSKHEMKDMYTSFFGVPLAGAIPPVVAAIIMGIYANNYLLVVAAIILGIGHIGIHYQHYKELQETA